MCLSFPVGAAFLRTTGNTETTRVFHSGNVVVNRALSIPKRTQRTISFELGVSKTTPRRMMAGRLLSRCLRSGGPQIQVTRRMAGFTDKVGNREVVGYGVNGEASYLDIQLFPMPAVRFKEITPDIQALKEKEKGDWKKLSIEEKKALYRASFCQTFAEMDAPTGEWKSILGMLLMMASTSLWIYILLRKYVYEPLPSSFDDENQLLQLERMRKLEMNPISGYLKNYK